MKKIITVTLSALMAIGAIAQEFNPIPRAWKWLDDDDVIFTYDGTYYDKDGFSVNARTGKRTDDAMAPAKYSEFPIYPIGAMNLTYSPDQTKLAFTRDNDLYVVDIETEVETRLTFDGSDVILNGYASWVYYEEILGRPSKYKAFWWSPDSKKIGFYRFDNSQVPMFPIYSAFANPMAAMSQSQSPRVTDLALGGSLSETRYPKAGQTKTRLMDLLSGEQCAQLHWAFLRDLAQVYEKLDADLFVFHTQDPDWELLKPVFPDAMGFFPQIGPGLGEKMNNALNAVLALGYDAVVLTGADLPTMNASHLRSGFHGLLHADVTLGPTSDGGYYLVGVKSPAPYLFENQTYGAGSVFDNARSAAAAAGKSFCQVLPCDDVDTPEDLRALRLDHDSHTACYLRKIGVI